MNKQDRCRNSQLNRIVVNDGYHEKRIYENELDSYLASG